MLHEIKAEIRELITNRTFALNLSLTTMAIVFSLSGLAELQSQNTISTQHSSTTNVSNLSTKVIVDRQQ